MDRGDSTWNEQIRVDSLLRTKIIALVVGAILFPIMSIRCANEVEREREAEEARLKSNGWICISSSDEVSAELLARKRSDAEFGTNNYSFQATNVVDYRFWYLVSPKTNTTERTMQR